MPTGAKTVEKRVDPKWTRWEKQHKKLQRILHDTETSESIHGKKWVAKMVNHWKGVLKQWEELEPVKFED